MTERLFSDVRRAPAAPEPACPQMVEQQIGEESNAFYATARL